MAKSFNGFIGQSKTVRHLKSQLEGAQALDKPCPHLLIIGSSGMGKTKLAKALALEAGTCLFVVHGKATPKDLCSQIIQLQKGDFLLLDEAHTLPRNSQEALYEVIDTYRMTDRLAPGSSAKGGPPKHGSKLIIQPMTIILATNYPSEILEALHRRMDLVVVIQDYTKRELQEIIGSAASNMNLLYSKSGLKYLARACQGQPSRAIKFVNGMQRMFWSESKRELSAKDVVKYLRSTGRDAYGMDREQQQYMHQLFHFEGRTGVATLASVLGLETEYVKNNVEAGLIRLGYVHRGSGGRSLTQEGWQWARDKQLIKQAKKNQKILDEVNKKLEEKKPGEKEEKEGEENESH